MHLKTNNSHFNAALRAELGSSYAKHTATLTREEAHRARAALQSMMSTSYTGTKTLSLKDETQALITACNHKLNEGGKG